MARGSVADVAAGLLELQHLLHGQLQGSGQRHIDRRSAQVGPEPLRVVLAQPASVGSATLRLVQ